MTNPSDVSVLIFSTNANIARTLRTALRGMSVRTVHLAADEAQVIEGFAVTDAAVALIYVEDAKNDAGVEMLRFLRRAPTSPRKHIPVVVASQSRDIATIRAVLNEGAHEYVLFPASGDQLLKKITSARNSNRPFIDTPDYVGPCRRRRVDPLYQGAERRAAVAANPETKAS